MSGWEVAAPVLLGIVLVAIIIFSVIRPSSAVRFGVFIERKILNGKHEPKESPPDEAPTKEIRRDDGW